MHVIASARASFVVRAYLRTICCTHAVRNQKDQTKCQLVNHRSVGACSQSPSLDALTATRSDEFIYSRCIRGQKGEWGAENGAEGRVLEISKLHINACEDIRNPLQLL